MNKKKNFKQIKTSALLLVTGLLLGLALGLLIIPKEKQISVKQVSPPVSEKKPSIENLVLPTVLGNPNSTVHLTEYSDFECEFCADYNKEIFKDLIKDYLEANLISYTHKDYLLNSYKNNIDAALLAYCAGEQDHFWDMYAQLLENQEEWAGKENPLLMFKKFINEIGLNIKDMDTCISYQKYISLIEKNIDEGKMLGVKKIPTIFVNDIKIEGLQSADYYKQVIDAEIQRTSLIAE